MAPVVMAVLVKAVVAPEATQRFADEELGGRAPTSVDDHLWLRKCVSQWSGYVIADWRDPSPSYREGEWAAIDCHRAACYERKNPLVIVFVGRTTCTLQIDLDSAQRPPGENFGGLNVAEQTAIDALMLPYRRQWADSSPVLRRWARVPSLDADKIAQAVRAGWRKAMTPRREPSARRAGAKRLRVVKYDTFYCGTCGALNAAFCDICRDRCCPTSAACHPQHRNRSSGSLETPAARAAWTVTLGK